MTDLDRMIEEALSDEDRALMGKFGEQGLFAQLFGVYKGPQTWIVALATIFTFVFLFGGVFAAWRFSQAGSAVEAMRWGAAG